MRVRTKPKNKLYLYAIIITICIFLITSGYSAFSDNLGITGFITHIRATKDIRVNGVTTNSGNVTDLDYDHDRIINSVYLQNNDSITYTTTVTNIGSGVMAVAGVRFTDSAGEAVSGVTANIDSANFVKVCNGNSCLSPVSRDVNVTITNNSGQTINEEINVILTFAEVYTISYAGNPIGEAVAGGNFSHTFTSSIPTKLAKASGNCTSFSYTNNTLSITDVQSDLNFIEAHTVTYNGDQIGTVANGTTFTHNFEPRFPATITIDSGTYDSQTYTNHILTITNVRSDIAITGIYGDVAITRIEHVPNSDKNVASSNNPTFSGMNASFSVVFRRPEGSTETDFETSYYVDITNSHYNDYIFRGLDFNPQIRASADSDSASLDLVPIDITEGEIIPAETTKTFTVKLVLTTLNPDGQYSTETNTQIDTTSDTEEETGTITASINATTGDLRSPNTKANFTVTVTSTYQSDKEFTLTSSNSKLDVVGPDGTTALGNLTIHGGSTETYQIAVVVADGATFIQNTANMNLYLRTDGLASIVVDSLTFNVDIYDVQDTTKITVSNARLSYYYDTANTRPTIKAEWDRDDIGGSGVENYVVRIYNANNNSYIKDCQTHSATRECLFASMSENTNYYVIVYGIDGAQNSGEDYVSRATTNPGYATKSPNASFSWTYTVNTSLNNLTVTSGGGSAIKGSKHTIIFTADSASSNNSYAVPENPTVTMQGSSGNFYTYARTNSNRTGTITINNVTGNMSVSGSRTGSCLIAGTKILMADGTYKNIENIKYDDLLAVWNYDTGSITYTYPAFIENDTEVYSYTKTTFSDGTTLGTFDSHGIFSYDLNRYILTTDTENYKVGARIVKIENGQVKIVTIKNIETIETMIRVYHIVSNGYFNIIANDILTTEPNIMISNQYGFEDNVKWPDGTRDNIINNPDNLYSFDLFSDIMPYYMYRALRVDEGKYVVDQGMITFDLLKLYLASRPANPLYFKDLPKKNNGKRLITITTSLDNVNLYNKYKYNYEEGSYYTLPNHYNIKCYLNTTNNTCYEKGSQVKVDTSTHFIAVYNN